MASPNSARGWLLGFADDIDAHGAFDLIPHPVCETGTGTRTGTGTGTADRCMDAWVHGYAQWSQPSSWGCCRRHRRRRGPLPAQGDGITTFNIGEHTAAQLPQTQSVPLASGCHRLLGDWRRPGRSLATACAGILPAAPVGRLSG